jgi:small-conductance mechanosensitive channel
MSEWFSQNSQIIIPFGILITALAVCLVIHKVVILVLGHLADKTDTESDGYLLKRLTAPTRWISLIITARIFTPTEIIGEKLTRDLNKTFGIAVIFLISWLIFRFLGVLEYFLLERFKMDIQDNLRSRKIHTQLRVARRIAVVIIVILAVASGLMLFESVRHFGSTLLASAGIAGIIIGFAAQRSLGTFFAGMQIAIAQPIRLDDVVIVEGEWGRIEEITLTYVVVKIWDLRRLILPITYFIEKPFQNWTRTSADILGTVYIYTDYNVDVEVIRKEVKRILDQSEYWDRKVWGVQVTDTNDKSVHVRALMSAADSSAAWNLRCHVREQLLNFIQEKYPQSLPRFRAEIERTGYEQGHQLPEENHDNTDTNNESKPEV